ncbi:PepSY domain-containing protein [Bacillus sp. FJAT-52991]|uniref:PepSY domain-containing protein n=1 Tax=Bacillus kandeliae TaxID=3129297 RepID=A0ABZ2N552_9BACI
MKRKWNIVLIICFVLVAVAFGVQQIVASMDTNVLTEKEVKQIVTGQYGGEIETMELTKTGEHSIYNVRLVNNRGTYHVAVNAENGDIMELKEISLAMSEKEAVDLALKVVSGTAKTVNLREDSVYVVEVETANHETTVVEIDKATGEVITKRVQKEQSSKITEQQAKEIAIKHVPGKVLQVMMQSKEGKRLFLVEVEKNPNETVMIEIEEATGAVLSTKAVIPLQTKITEQQAKEIASEQTAGGSISDIELIETNGGPIYQVITEKDKQTIDVRVHAITGNVLSITTIDHDDDDEDDDQDDEDED